MTPVVRFWRLLSLYRKEVRLIYLYAILNGIVNLSLPLGIQAIVNFIQTGDVSSSWIVLVFFVLLGISLTGVFQILQLRIVENIQQDIFARSSFEFAWRIPKIKISQLDHKHAPELVNRFFDTLTIQKGMPKILIDFSLASFQIIFGMLLLAVYSPYFIILAVSLVVILWIIFKVTGPKGLSTSLKESKYKYSLAHWIEEIARTNRSFKIFAGQEFHLKKTDNITLNYLKSREKHFSVLLNQFKYFIGFKVLIAAGLLFLGGILVFQNEMTIGQFVAAEIIIILIINSVEKIIRVIETIYDVLTALEKIGYITDLELDEEDGISEFYGDGGIKVELINISFRHIDADMKLFNNLNISIPSRSKTVIKGRSGIGKSTLLKLIAGLQGQSEGQVLLNNIPVQHYNRANLYQNIGFAFPTNQLIDGTIRENILMGREISDEVLGNMLDIVSLRDYISRLPLGIKSIVTPEGRKLPRAIIQKIQIARVLIGNPKLVLMEDPLQFVPDYEKNSLIDYIMSPDRPWTAIIIADHSYWEKKATQIINLSTLVE